MKRRKIVLSFILVMAIAIGGVTGCAPKEEKQVIGMVLSTLNNPFFLAMKDGAQRAAAEMGYTLVVLDSQNDPAKERSNIEDLLQLDPIALLINPTDSDAVVKSVEVANSHDVPVITLDRQSNGGLVTSHIASDNHMGGAMAAEYALETLGDKEKINVVELQGIPGASATRDRGAGFHSIMDAQANVTFVSSQAADFDRQKGLQVMENIMQANSDIQVVFAHNDEMALGAAKAIQSGGKEVIIIGFDGNDDALIAIENGEMSATVAQQPDLIGALGVELAQQIEQGEAVDAEIAADLKIIGQINE